MAAYPSTLPAPTVGGFSDAPVDATVRTTMDAGPARVRKRYTAVPHTVEIQLDLDDDEYTAFKAWFEDPLEADRGASWFWITLAMGNGGPAPYEARFIGPYRASPKEGGLPRWIVRAKLEVRGA